MPEVTLPDIAPATPPNKLPRNSPVPSCLFLFASQYPFVTTSPVYDGSKQFLTRNRLFKSMSLFFFKYLLLQYAIFVT
jgi:hypothetical protein